jgi:DNA-directed RNA polymerase specialized sigma24 family protein
LPELERALQRLRRRVQVAIEAFEVEVSLVGARKPAKGRKVSAKASSTWELSRRCLDLQAQRDLSHGEIAEELNLDRSTVANFLRLRRRLDPAIATAWRKGHPRATQGNLLRLVGLCQADQLTAWRKLAHPAHQTH